QSHCEGYLWSDIGIPAFRIVGAFVIALAAALAIGMLLGRSRLAERLFGPWVTIGASIPSLVVIVIVYLSVGVNDHAAMIGTALIVGPPMVFAVVGGLRGLGWHSRHQSGIARDGAGFCDPEIHDPVAGHPAADHAVYFHCGTYWFVADMAADDFRRAARSFFRGRLSHPVFLQSRGHEA